MYVTRYSIGHKLLCAVGICEFHPKEMVAFNCSITAVSLGSATRGETIAWLPVQLLCQPGERLCALKLCYVMPAAKVAAPARRE